MKFDSFAAGNSRWISAVITVTLRSLCAGVGTDNALTKIYIRFRNESRGIIPNRNYGGVLTPGLERSDTGTSADSGDLGFPGVPKRQPDPQSSQFRSFLHVDRGSGRSRAGAF